MPTHQPAKATVHLKSSHQPVGSADYVPSTARDGILAQRHIPPFAEHLRTLVAPFNALNYLHQFGPLMVSYLAAGHSHRQLYNFLTKQQAHPVPVSYSQFSRALAVFRQQKGLPATQVRKPRRPPAAVGNAHDAPLTSLPAAAPRIVAAAQSAASSTATPHGPTAPTHVAAALPGSAAVPIVPGGEVLSAEEIETREIEARLAKRFRPFTAEDAKRGKPIREAILDHQRTELEAYERGLKDGTITD